MVDGEWWMVDGVYWMVNGVTVYGELQEKFNDKCESLKCDYFQTFYDNLTFKSY